MIILTNVFHWSNSIIIVHDYIEEYKRARFFFRNLFGVTIHSLTYSVTEDKNKRPDSGNRFQYNFDKYGLFTET